MTSQSRKAKGRTLQQLACKALAKAGHRFGLVSDDFLSRSMGANGEDVILSPAAVRVYGDVKVECKAQESLNVYATFLEHSAKYPKSDAVLIHKKNHRIPLATITLDYFIFLLTRSAQLGKDNKGDTVKSPRGEAT